MVFCYFLPRDHYGESMGWNVEESSGNLAKWLQKSGKCLKLTGESWLSMIWVYNGYFRDSFRFFVFFIKFWWNLLIREIFGVVTFHRSEDATNFSKVAWRKHGTGLSQFSRILYPFNGNYIVNRTTVTAWPSWRKYWNFHILRGWG